MIIKVTYNVTDVYMSTTSNPIYINVSYGDGGGGASVWGQITGTLSDQTDLQSALDAKVPYTGATANVDLGEYELKAGQIEYDQTPTGVAGVATTRWNDSVGTIETTLKGGNVVLKHGRDMFERVVNKTGVQLTRASYQAVRVSTAQGQRLGVALAQANNDNNSADTIGLAVETIDNNQEGMIYTIGEIDGINTTGSLQGETWADGDVLYLSPITPGSITNVKPIAPQHLVVIGYVVYAHANNGKIYVKVMNGWEIGELHDVDTTGATNGQVLTYNGSIWVPTTNGAGTVTSVAATGGTGISISGSPITSSGTLTITNTAPDQTVSLTQGGTTTITGTYPNFTISSADQYTGTVTSVGLTSTTSGVTITGSPITTSGSLTLDIETASGSTTGLLSSTDWTTFNNKQSALTNPVTGTGTSGQVSYWSGTTTQTGSNNFIWNDSTKLLSLTTEAAGVRGLYIGQYGNIIGAASCLFYKSRGTIASPSNVLTNDLIGAFVFNARVGGTDTSDRALFGAHMATSTGIGLYFIAGSTNSNFTPSLYIHPSGNTILGTSTNIIGGTPTDGGQRLQVQGDAFIKGSGSTSGTTALTVQNSDGNNALRVRNDGVFLLGTATSRPIISILSGISTESISGTALAFSYTSTANTPTVGFYFNASNTFTNTSGSFDLIRSNLNFSPASGTATITNIILTPTINQTGGANGITRGLYVNPTLTAAADWRSIEWSNNSGWGLYGAGTANNYLNGDTSIGTTTLGTATKLTIGGSETASSAIARGTLINTTLTASANNDVLVGLDVSPTFTNGAFTGVSNIGLRVGGTSGLNYDVANQRLGIGTNAPVTNLEITTSDTPTFRVASTGAAASNAGRAAFTIARIASGSETGWQFLKDANDHFLFRSISAGSTTARMGLFTSGNLLIQNGGTFTDAGFRLDVNGTARVQGNFRIDSNIRDNRDNSLIQQSASGVTANRDLTLGNATYGRFIFNTKEVYFTQGTAPALGSYGFYFNGETSIGAVSGLSIYFKAQTPAAATNNNGGDFIIDLPSGTGTGRQGRIGLGQTSPTAIVDIAASTTANASLRIRSGTAPTTPNDGDIWFDGTDIKMRIGGVTKTFTLT